MARQEGDELPAVRSAIATQGRGSIHFRAFDLMNVEAIPGLVRSLGQDFGPFYGLVNNAGLGTSGVLSIMRDDAITQMLRLNVEAALVLTKHLLRHMMHAREGRIVNISSIVASKGFAGLSAYSATKAALAGFARSLAREVGPLGITVNSVAPGFVATEMTREMTASELVSVGQRSALRRVAEVADVAAAVGFLFSAQARNITGTVLTVDAGQIA